MAHLYRNAIEKSQINYCRQLSGIHRKHQIRSAPPPPLASSDSRSYISPLTLPL